jgi:hypothetical protein
VKYSRAVNIDFIPVFEAEPSLLCWTMGEYSSPWPGQSQTRQHS